MSEYKYIDIHTHKNLEEFDKDVIYFQNILYPNVPKHDRQIVSIHPWSLPKELHETIHYLKENCPANTILGEIGLDKKCKVSEELQQLHFKASLEFAVANSLKAITIHSVKANDECLALIKKKKFKGSIIFHNFFGSVAQTKKLLEHEMVYLSLGEVLRRPQSKLFPILKEIPLKRLFFETDDSSFSIKEQYECFQQITNHRLDHIKKVCYHNYQNILGEHYD